ncbi:hypothetical protein BDU57DRAFT_574610 [Ampelomyces quisqualis]|uniref:Uncharacterized protein n=1 Tax=Ampelomyces quisqualis TaxID=50730 RepID=A0A6A5QMJ6_AMPQU|nr:hypothetical protein BDU57DRAFT_574610 [Ampelomyces quisqualis]
MDPQRPSDINPLLDMTCNLTHVSTKVPRNGTWPLDSLSAISSFPKPRSADNFMNNEHQTPKRPTTISSRHDAVSRMGGNLDGLLCGEISGNGLQELVNVIFYVGDWTRGWTGRCASQFGSRTRRAKMVCKAEGLEKDDWCVVERGEKYWQNGHRKEYMDDCWRVPKEWVQVAVWTSRVASCELLHYKIY